MKVLIIDDSSTATEILSQKLKQFSDIEIVGMAYNGENGLKAAKETKPELVFLDIELPDMSGLTILEQLNSILTEWCQIVMYTGHHNYMLPAFRSNAFDYLMKPIDDNELQEVMKRVYANYQNGVSTSISGLIKQKTDEKILFYTNTADFKLVHIQDICVFQYNSETRVWEVIVACSKDPIKLKRNINNESLLALDKRFIQVSQRFIININYLLEVRNNTCYFYPPFDSIVHVKVGKVYRKKLTERFSSL